MAGGFSEDLAGGGRQWQADWQDAEVGGFTLLKVKQNLHGQTKLNYGLIVSRSLIQFLRCQIENNVFVFL